MAAKKEWCEVGRKIEALGETLKITAVGKTAVLAEGSHGEESMVKFEDIEDIANA
jgi:hypothetical protein